MRISNIFTRDFVHAFFAQFAFMSAYFILIPTLPIYLSRLKITESEIGILIGVFSVSSLLSRPFIGKGLQRIPERTFMFTGAILSALSSMAYLVASPFWPFFLVRVFQGIGLAFFLTSSTTLIANISPEGNRGQSLSYFFLGSNIAFALAPSLGMFLINRFSFTLLFLFCATISVASLFLTTRLKKREGMPLDDPSTKGEGLFSRRALPACIMTFFTHVIWGSFTTFIPLYAVEQGAINPGFFFTIFAFMLISCRTLGAKLLDLYSREKILFPCLITYAFAALLLAFSKTFPMFILVAVIWGIGTSFAYPGLVALTLDLAGPARGPALGTFTAFSDLGVGLGAMTMGFVLRATNYQIMFLCLALVGIINLLYFNHFVKKTKKG